jgi:hypothetical protein
MMVSDYCWLSEGVRPGTGLEALYQDTPPSWNNFHVRDILETQICRFASRKRVSCSFHASIIGYSCHAIWRRECSSGSECLAVLTSSSSRLPRCERFLPDFSHFYLPASTRGSVDKSSHTIEQFVELSILHAVCAYMRCKTLPSLPYHPHTSPVSSGVMARHIMLRGI